MSRERGRLSPSPFILTHSTEHLPKAKLKVKPEPLDETLAKAKPSIYAKESKV